MKNILYTFIFFLAFKFTTTAQQIGSIEQFNLSNGLQVSIIQYGQLNTVSVALYINCGKKNETPGQQALAELAAASVSLGNLKYDRQTMNDELFGMGTTIAASSNDNYSVVSSSFTLDDLEKGMDIFSNAVLHPLFPESEIKQIINQTIDFNSTSQMDITQQAQVFSNFWVYGASNPVGRYFYKTQLEKISIAGIKEFYDFNYTPKNSRLVICGMITKDKAKALAEKYFANWQAAYGEVNGVSFESPTIKKKEYAFVNRINATQATLQWNKTGPDTKSKDVLAFRVANSVFNNVLFKEIREKGGKTYGISSDYNYYSASSIYNIRTSVRSDEVLNTIKLFDVTLLNFYNNSISQEQFITAKKSLKNSFLMISDPEDLISFYNPLIYPNPSQAQEFLSIIDKMTLEEVNKIIKKYYSPEAYKLLIAGYKTDLQKQLESLGTFKEFTSIDIAVDQ